MIYGPWTYRAVIAGKSRAVCWSLPVPRCPERRYGASRSDEQSSLVFQQHATSAMDANVPVVQMLVHVDMLHFLLLVCCSCFTTFALNTIIIFMLQFRGTIIFFYPHFYNQFFKFHLFMLMLQIILKLFSG